MGMGKELDAFLADYVVPVFREHGFRKSSHTWRWSADNGDVVVVRVRGYPLGLDASWHCDAALYTHSKWTFHRVDRGSSAKWPEPYVGEYSWKQNVVPAAPAPGVMAPIPWGYDDAFTRLATGEAFAATLSSLLPRLIALCDRSCLLDQLMLSEEFVSPRDELLIRLDSGPSPRLAELMLAAERGDRWERKAELWARQQLTEHGVTSADWASAEERSRATAHAVDQVIANELARSMTEAGFAWRENAFRLTSAHGDEAIVEVTQSAQASPEHPVLLVRSGIVTAPALAWRRAVTPRYEGLAKDCPLVPGAAWLVEVHAPEPLHSVPGAAADILELPRWAITDNAERGVQLRALLAPRLEMLRANLDRDTLLASTGAAHIGQFGDVRNAERTALLLYADGPSARLSAARALLPPALHDISLADWISLRMRELGHA
jgi:hypothetical protein